MSVTTCSLVLYFTKKMHSCNCTFANSITFQFHRVRHLHSLLTSYSEDICTFIVKEQLQATYYCLSVNN